MQNVNWWLYMDDIEVGYWPNSILISLPKNATNLIWGGEITNLRSNGSHTLTQMGSGHFPHEGFGKASMIHNLTYVRQFRCPRAC